MARMKGLRKCGELAALLAVRPLWIFHSPLHHGGRGHYLSLCSDGSTLGGLGELSHELSDAIHSEQWVIMLPRSLLFLINTLS